MKTHQHLQNHNARHIERIKEGTITATSIKPMDVGCPGNWEKTRNVTSNPFSSSPRLPAHLSVGTIINCFRRMGNSGCISHIPRGLILTATLNLFFLLNPTETTVGLLL